MSKSLTATPAETLLRRERLLLAFCLLLIGVLSWWYLLAGAGTGMSTLAMTTWEFPPPVYRSSAGSGWDASYWLIMLLMWWVMMVAMMLPSVSPTVLLYASLLRHGGNATDVPSITSAFLVGYLVTWAGFSAIATTAQWGLEKAGLVSASMMTLIETVPGALVLILAGVFQFTPLKAACLRHCRSPAEFIARRRRKGHGGAFVMGLEHGVFCLGCCWFLMALLFVGGIMNLYWIVGLTAFVALEKLSPYGQTISKIAGLGLIVWGGAILLGAT